jgi:hypothetical protein
MGSTADELRRESRRKRRNRISEAFSVHPVSMLRSPARRVLSRAARQFLDRLEIELCDHGGNDNGRLPLTFDDCVDHGIHRNAVAPAQREAVKLGFAELTKRGRGGNAEYREPNLWRLTYVHGRGGIEPTHEWRKIVSLEEAEAIARGARKAKNPMAVRYGRQAARGRKFRNQYRKPIPAPVSETDTENEKSPVSETDTTG